MINKLHIANFKSFRETTLELAPLTILTGLNSVGKSTCIQAILEVVRQNGGTGALLLEAPDLNMDFSFETMRNRYENAKSYIIEIEYGDLHEKIIRSEDDTSITGDTSLRLEENIFYLNANRQAFKNIEDSSSNYKVGITGEYLIGTFNREKSVSLRKVLIKDDSSETLQSQLNWWLSHILNLKFEVRTEVLTSNKVKTVYKGDELDNLTPAQLGVGVSSLAKILIMCLRAKEGDVLMIENPAIHLHPAAQAKLGEFLCFIAKRNVQLIVETHCEHMINHIQYEIYKKNIGNNDVIVYYKNSIYEDFEKITFNNRGKFITEFPSGFFDATLDELLIID